jgi:hypothetical protein
MRSFKIFPSPVFFRMIKSREMAGTKYLVGRGNGCVGQRTFGKDHRELSE